MFQLDAGSPYVSYRCNYCTVQSRTVKLPTPKMGAMYHVLQHISVDI